MDDGEVAADKKKKRTVTKELGWKQRQRKEDGERKREKRERERKKNRKSFLFFID